ncbi:hypothetical protein SteCoe_38598 [Stentor coeruleus]|uniref:Peptidase M14 domain-containing protein n=1 Tax=Stentor coeruleus TaxID=5963 RepID=A0A1R2ALB9_9CILI|nr:hypothetical protein SteCoe_38598 [Stentor coeruleus]
MEFPIIFFLYLVIGASSNTSLSGYYSYSELNLKMDELLNAYSEIISKDSDVGGLRLNSQKSITILKRKILIIGGLYGGYPIDAYQVLYILESLAKNYKSNDTEVIKAIDSVIIDFLPALNKDAYVKSEAAFNESEKFQVIYTDLKSEVNCSNNPFAGTNLDRNFPINWNLSNDPCSDDYSGKEPLSSTALAWAKNTSTEYFYDFIVNFQGDGNYYAYPSAYKYYNHSPLEEYVYQRVMSAIPHDYFGGQMTNITNTSLCGTLLDTLGKNHFAIQVAIGASNKSIKAPAIDTEVKNHYDLVFAEIISRYSQVSAYFVKSEESKCNGNCDYYSNVTIEFEIMNNSTISLSFSLLLNITFNNDSLFSLPEINCSGLHIYDNSSYNVTFNQFENEFNITSQRLNALSRITIQLSYTRYNKTDDEFFFVYQGIFINENLNSTGESFSETIRDKCDSENSKTGFIVGIILGSAFFIIAIIVIFALCKCKKSEPDKRA